MTQSNLHHGPSQPAFTEATEYEHFSAIPRHKKIPSVFQQHNLQLMVAGLGLKKQSERKL